MILIYATRTWSSVLMARVLGPPIQQHLSCSDLNQDMTPQNSNPSSAMLLLSQKEQNDDQFNTNYSVPEEQFGGAFFRWRFNQENLRAWISFCCCKACSAAPVTALKLRCWYSLSPWSYFPSLECVEFEVLCNTEPFPLEEPCWHDELLCLLIHFSCL